MSAFADQIHALQADALERIRDIDAEISSLYRERQEIVRIFALQDGRSHGRRSTRGGSWASRITNAYGATSDPFLARDAAHAILATNGDPKAAQRDRQSFYAALAQMTRRGDLERVSPGVYRFPGGES